ncbi:DUF4238 domain-containing protein [Rhodococcus triatomae]
MSWLTSLDRHAKVGAKHHIIPRFLLKRWANGAGQVQAFSRADNRFSQRSVADLAVRDFYTFVAVDGSSDSTFEEFLAKVEDPASELIGWLLSPLRSPGTALTVDQRQSLDLFVAFQFARGPRTRREIEQIADYYGKTMSEEHVDDDELAELEFVPHQNDHIRTMGNLAESVWTNLHRRPVHLLRLDRPLVWLSDEPVVVDADDTDDDHHPDCSLTTKELRRRARKAKTKGEEFSTIVHVRPVRRRGLLDADAVLMPLSPQAVLAYGPVDPDIDLRIHEATLNEDAATEFAGELNNKTAVGALDVIVGPPNDHHFRDQPMPDPAPILHVCGPKSIASDALNRPLRRVRPNRYLRQT